MNKNIGNKANHLKVYLGEHPFSSHHPIWEFQRLFKKRQKEACVEGECSLNHKNITISIRF